MEILEQLRRRSKRQWREMYDELLCNARIWIQEHGELALLLGIAMGVIAVVFFKPLLTVLLIAGLIGFAVWSLAPEEAKGGHEGKDDDSSATTH